MHVLDKALLRLFSTRCTATPVASLRGLARSRDNFLRSGKRSWIYFTSLRVFPSLLASALWAASFATSEKQPLKALLHEAIVGFWTLQIDGFHLTSRRPYLCPKWILWDFSSILIQTFPIVSALQYGRRSREWKPSIVVWSALWLFCNKLEVLQEAFLL